MNAIHVYRVFVKYALRYVWKRNKWVLLIAAAFLLSTLFSSAPRTAIANGLTSATNLVRDADAAPHILDEDRTGESAAFIAAFPVTTPNATARRLRIPAGFGANLSTNQSATIVIRGYSESTFDAPFETLLRTKTGYGPLEVVREDAYAINVFILCALLSLIVFTHIKDGRVEGTMEYQHAIVPIWMRIAFSGVFYAGLLISVGVVAGSLVRTLVAGAFCYALAIFCGFWLNPKSWVAEQMSLVTTGAFLLSYQLVLRGFGAYLPFFSVFTNPHLVLGVGVTLAGSVLLFFGIRRVFTVVA